VKLIQISIVFYSHIDYRLNNTILVKYKTVRFMHRKYFILLMLVLPGCWVTAQPNNYTEPAYFRCAFYNLENFFDPYPDTTLSYNEYTSKGEMHWTQKKFEKKSKYIYKVLQAMSEWDGLTLLGVCEIENETVLNQLLLGTPLKEQGLKYVHFDSGDKRGIDIALIYNTRFKPVFSTAFSVSENGKPIASRDILYVKGMLAGQTLHVFVNHWTSRYRGLMESDELRMMFSQLLKSKTDSIMDADKQANIIVMGDFNDQLQDNSIQNLLKEGNLINLHVSSINGNAKGTMKFREQWFTFDQVFVSQPLANGMGKLVVDGNKLNIFDEAFLLEKDEKYLGNKPFRTNIGFKYHGGFSDHLPVYFDLKLK